MTVAREEAVETDSNSRLVLSVYVLLQINSYVFKNVTNCTVMVKMSCLLNFIYLYFYLTILYFFIFFLCIFSFSVAFSFLPRLYDVEPIRSSVNCRIYSIISDLYAHALIYKLKLERGATYLVNLI